jgi:uncharacterized protein (DUF1330 family)
MPKGYVIAHIRVRDRAGFEEFKRMAEPAIAAHGGRVLVRNPDVDHREGSLRGVAVVIEFENMEIARSFYESDAYTAARRVRESTAETDLMLVEGMA